MGTGKLQQSLFSSSRLCDSSYIPTLFLYHLRSVRSPSDRASPPQSDLFLDNPDRSTSASAPPDRLLQNHHRRPHLPLYDNTNNTNNNTNNFRQYHFHYALHYNHHYRLFCPVDLHHFLQRQIIVQEH